jgi:hypothetical protein
MSPKFKKIKNDVLGRSYDLSFSYVTPTQMRKAMKYKPALPAGKRIKRSTISNVLAFPLSKTSGEILICKKAAKPFTVAYLFIHGLYHLKGYKHSATMERIERRTFAKFGFKRNE